jgi:hypothetical protein
VAKPNPQRRARQPDDAPRRWYHRVPWVALAISLAVVLSSGLAVQPILDAATGEDIAEASLSRPIAYVLLAPLSNTLDTLVLLSVRQHAALLLGVLALFGVWRAVKGVMRGLQWRSHLLAFAVLLVAIIAIYAAGALLPRPMAALVSDNANIVRVDFHSHTDASHDGRQSVEANRRWHERAGFDVAFITDHGVVTGAERAVATNPRVAGEGTTLLQSIEVTWDGEHVSIPGAQRIYNGLLTQNLRDVDTVGLRLGSIIPSREPVVIWNHPHALTAGTDNHGWGYAAPGWTLMRIFNWRSMTPDALGNQIDAVIRAGAWGSTRVVERRVADSRQMLWASVATVPGRMLTTLSNDERVAWLIWTWLITGGLWFWRRRRASA